MEKRYQVFISSTLKDLENARQEVSQALLRADCFPAGMELLPAADEEQFEFIKTVIDQSDYYIIISAGRYGSIHPETELSYTEMEYDYAVETGKPVIRLLHKDPFNELKGESIEKTDEGRKKLQAFRDKMTASRLVKFWENSEQLMLETLFALQDAQKRKPVSGWVRGDEISTQTAREEIANLKQKEAEFKLEIERLRKNDRQFDILLDSINESIEIEFQVKNKTSYSDDGQSSNEISGPFTELEELEKIFELKFNRILRSRAKFCFENLSTQDVKSRVEKALTNTFYSTKQKTNFTFSVKDIDGIVWSALHKLESHGIIRSYSHESEVEGLFNTGKRVKRVIRWELLDAARPWISSQLAEMRLEDLNIKTPPQSAP